MIFTAAADDDSEQIVENAFENVEQGKSKLCSLLVFSILYYLHLFNCINSDTEAACSYPGTF